MTQRPSMSTVIRQAILGGIADVRVHVVARVESYDAAKRRISARPIIRALYADEENAHVAERMPIITDIPLAMPGSGGARLKFPVARGDTVLLCFSDQSLDRWLALGGEDVDPEDPRSHALSDAIALPGVQAFPEASDAATFIEVTDSKIDLGGGATEPAILGNAYRTAENTMLTAIKTWVGLIGTATGVDGTTVLAAITAFQNNAGLLAELVRVK
jgi:hypothetical protein